mmetsp:Transcript_40390/g.66343  ORF Transcript_40390/g.66343 Transcript_40390/m.66343 type:complete len:230 (+) Transcript_40390:28-717(+)
MARRDCVPSYSWRLSSLFCIILWIDISFAQKLSNSCEYHCTDHRQTPWNKPDYVYQSNGCGAMGIKVNVDPRIKHCCNTHDACYGVCGISRDFCDLQFKRCMDKGCKGDQQCISSAGMITMGAQLFGCEPFLQGQQSDCDCLNEFEFQQRIVPTLKEMYQQLPADSRKSDDEIEKIREKYKGKEAKLINFILEKYPQHLIELVDMETGQPLNPKPKTKSDESETKKTEL